jgi:glutaredoxin
MENKEMYVDDISFMPPPPNIFGITIYGKSSCVRCEELRDMLDSSNMDYKYIDCDDYIMADKENFKNIMFEYMKLIPQKRILYFPVCFVDGLYFSSIGKFLYKA